MKKLTFIAAALAMSSTLISPSVMAQQKFVTQKVMDKVKAEQAAKLEAQGRVIEVERREQKKRQHKKN